jgi:hypothetical protein
VLAELDAELADSSAEFEQKYGDPLDYSAADRAVREMVACEIDRKVWLLAAYDRAGDDVALRVKLATELRLTEQSVARLLRQINTGPPPEPLSQKSKKAQRAAYVKWGRESG